MMISESLQKQLFGWATRKKAPAKVTPAEDPTRQPSGGQSPNGSTNKVISLALSLIHI